MRLWRALQRRPLTPVRAGHGGRVNAHGRRDGGPGWSTATCGVGMTSSCSCSGSLRPWPVAARVLRRERRPRGAGEDVRRWVRAAAPRVSSGVLNCWLVLPLLNKKNTTFVRLSLFSECVLYALSKILVISQASSSLATSLNKALQWCSCA